MIEEKTTANKPHRLGRAKGDKNINRFLVSFKKNLM